MGRSRSERWGEANRNRGAKYSGKCRGYAYTLVMEFIYQPFEPEDGKWGYPCIGVNRYLTRK